VTLLDKSYLDSSQKLLEYASSPQSNHTEVISFADIKLKDTGDESWALPKAFSLWQLSRPQQAMCALDIAQAVCSNDPNFHMLRGVIARQLPNNTGYTIALQAYRTAIRISPGRADAYYCLANLVSDTDIPYSESLYRRSIELDPSQHLAWHNLGRMICFDDRPETAMPLLRQAVTLDPTYADGWCNLGLSWLAIQEYDKALCCFYQAISLDSSHGATHINIGNALISKLEPDAALKYLERGAELESSSSNSLWNLSLCYLLLGRFSEGWKLYESRYQTDMFDAVHIPTSGPKISDLKQLISSSDRGVVVWAEQGMGDSIQFFRYLYLLSSLGIPFEFHCRHQLLRLFNEWSPFSNSIVQERSTDPSVDIRPHISLMSLPMIFDTQLHSVPSSVPYLKPNISIPEHLQIEQPPGGLSVGLVWASNPDNKAMYKSKSVPLSLLMPLFNKLLDLDLIHLHCLQFGSDVSQLQPWLREGVTNWSDRLDDFSETSHVLNQLDLVVSVDTAVAHLAGSLNIPTWLLLPDNADFRWLRHIDYSPWYPSMRLFRQSHRGDWQSVYSQLLEAFSELTLLNLNTFPETSL